MDKHIVDLDPEDGDFRGCPFSHSDDGFTRCEHPANRNPRWEEKGEKMYLVVDTDECPHGYQAPMDEQGMQAYMTCAAPTCPLRENPVEIEGKARLKFKPCKGR